MSHSYKISLKAPFLQKFYLTDNNSHHQHSETASSYFYGNKHNNFHLLPIDFVLQLRHGLCV